MKEIRKETEIQSTVKFLVYYSRSAESKAYFKNKIDEYNLIKKTLKNYCCPNKDMINLDLLYCHLKEIN